MMVRGGNGKSLSAERDDGGARETEAGRRLTVIDQRGRPVPSSATTETTASTTIRGLSFDQGKGKRGSPQVKVLPAMDAAVREMGERDSPAPL
ncbi:unnamed protein product [Linum trigynum]|uniref:Uncharacterized protein n=1 Tax=Linum trigynum TaxID=586398 RepID=A0AAV2GJV3_9ROSI